MYPLSLNFLTLPCILNIWLIELLLGFSKLIMIKITTFINARNLYFFGPISIFRTYKEHISFFLLLITFQVKYFAFDSSSYLIFFLNSSYIDLIISSLSNYLLGIYPKNVITLKCWNIQLIRKLNYIIIPSKSGSLMVLIKGQMWELFLDFLTLYIWSRFWEFSFLTHSQVALMPLVQGSYIENQ